MIINQITITAEASKAYQKYCVALTAEELQEGDIEYLKRMAISEAVKGIDELAGHIDVKPEVKVTQQPVQNNQYQVPKANQGYTPRPQQYQPTNNRPASQKQLDYLRNAFNYVPQGQITFEQANELLMQFKSQR